MAVIRVRSSDGDDADDGSTWALAKATLAGAIAALSAAGDEIWVDSAHSETALGNTTYTFANGTPEDPIIVLCVDSSDDSLSDMVTGGGTMSNSVNNDFNLHGSVYMYGMKFVCGDDFQLCNSNHSQVYENCNFSLGFAAASSTFRPVAFQAENARTRLISCVIDFSIETTATPIEISNECVVNFTDCDISSSSAGTNNLLTFLVNEGFGSVVFEGCDLSDWDNLAVLTSAGMNGSITFSSCILKSGYSVTTGTEPANETELRIRLENCIAGTNLTDPPLGLSDFWMPQGTVTSTLSKYRTGGATDGEQANPVGWEMSGDASKIKEIYTALESPPMTAWVDGGASVTVTIYVAHDSGDTFNDDDFWITIISPDETASPNNSAKANYYSSRMAPRGTPAQIGAADASSTWNGSNVGTKRKLSRTFTPTLAGPVTVRCYLAIDTSNPPTTAYPIVVDPKIEII